MRILVVGAGGIGGYFGGRLLVAGRDVTFLVRPPRAARLAETGLVIRSPKGDLELAAPPTVTADALRGHYDLVLLACKTYDLGAAVDAFAPAVGPETAILPVLNGMRHMDVLDARFGPARVLGGLCIISAALDPEGRILHLSDFHSLAFGGRQGFPPARLEAVAAALAGAGFDSRVSGAILQDMWDKWVFIAALAGMTCLMRASIGDVIAAGAGDIGSRFYGECAAIAASCGFAPTETATQRSRGIMSAKGSPLVASMLRDIERGAAIEADDIVGALLVRAGQGVETPLLRLAFAHLKAYEARRAREADAAG